MEPALSLSGVRKSYGAVSALQDITLRVEVGEYVTILGPSGAGKSSMLRVISGFDEPDAGEVQVAGRSVVGIPAHMRDVGFVFQSFALFPHLTVAQNIAFGLENRYKNTVTDAAEVRRQVNEMLELVGLTGLGGRAINQISGGQKQRVALARTLICKPEVVLLDEPLGALDANLREHMMVELQHIQRRLGNTFLHVTGNEQEALAMGNRVAVIDSGRLVQIGEPRSLFEKPTSLEVARLLNCYNFLEDKGQTTRAIRTDRVHVSDQASTEIGFSSIEGRFVANEYSGSKVVALFDTGHGRHFEVAYQLSHKRPPDFTQGQSKHLTWRAEDALVYSAA
jgi:ABC-type Fe3+/spermidine/putrescine transport system ATPase subunit